jgi:hypothetical protein
LLTPTPTAIERSENFLQRDDETTIAAAWREFDYVWIPSTLTADAAAGLARFSGEAATGRIFRVRSSATSVTLERLDPER